MDINIRIQELRQALLITENDRLIRLITDTFNSLDPLSQQAFYDILNPDNFSDSRQFRTFLSQIIDRIGWWSPDDQGQANNINGFLSSLSITNQTRETNAGIRASRLRDRANPARDINQLQRRSLPQVQPKRKRENIKNLGLEDYSNPGELPECSICLSEIEQGDGTRIHKCGHIFHRSCINELLAQPGSSNGAKCPNCRAGINETSTFFGKKRNTFALELKYLQAL
jgi:hypothetical protein